MSSEVSQYLSEEALERIDLDFTLLMRRHIMTCERNAIEETPKPVIGSDYTPELHEQNHQRWPDGALQRLAQVPVIKPRRKS